MRHYISTLYSILRHCQAIRHKITLRSIFWNFVFSLQILAMALIGSLHAEEEEPFHYLGHEFDITPLGDSIDRASINLFKEAYESAKDKNLITSPLGVFTLLTLYAAGAGPASREEIVKALGAENYEKLAESYNGLGEQFSKMDRNFLTIANRIYLSNQFNLSDSFTTAARNAQGSVKRVSFQAPQQAIEEINHWAEEETRGHLKAPVPSDAIDSDTVVALFNLIFFQGHWNVPFEAKDTKDEDFHVDRSTTVKKPTMHLLQSLFIYENEDFGAKLVELPYKENGFRMVLVVPDEIDGLPSVIEKASKKGLLADVFKLEPAGVDIDLYLPKFSIESGLDLNALLPKVGISKIFSEGASNLVKDTAVVVSKAFQKAFVKVDEEGATAGAFTGLVAVPMSSLSRPPPPMLLRVDHPFLFLILHEDKILFTGTYTH